jgi:hypothetical protein
MTIEGFQRIIIFFGRAQGLGQGESAGAILGYTTPRERRDAAE